VFFLPSSTARASARNSPLRSEESG
jgi:hypothetical protein